MHYSDGLRIPRYLLAVLAVASPLLANGGEGKLAPVVDLNPRHTEAASSDLREPSALIVEAKAVPLPSAAVSSAGSQPEPKRTKLRPAVRFAPPFDPTNGTAQQQNIATGKPQADAVRIAPVIRVYEPIRETPRTTLENTQLAADGTKPTNESASIPSPSLESVHRSVFPATRTDRLQRTNASRTLPIQTRDALSARMLATLGSFTDPKPVPLIGHSFSPQSESVEQQADVRPLQLSGFIKFAEGDPIARKSANPKTDQSIAPGLAAQPLLNAVRTPIEPVPSELTSNSGKEFNSTIENALSATPTVLSEEAIDVATVLAKRSAPVVELANTPIFRQSSTIALSPKRMLEAKPEPVLDSAAEIVLERDVPAEAFAQEQSPTITTKPVMQLADAEPLLAVLQLSPSASDLPAPMEQQALTEEQRSQLEEIEAFELDIKPIKSLTARTKPEAGEMPTNYAAARFAREGAVAHRMGFSRSHTETEMMWEAPAICHRPLYFEDINLERHGYKIPVIQPALSAAHFFGRVPLLPYMMVNEGHRDCQYTLGHYRPGDYAPYSLYVPRLRLDASAAELAAVAGVIFAFP